MNREQMEQILNRLIEFLNKKAQGIYDVPDNIYASLSSTTVHIRGSSKKALPEELSTALQCTKEELFTCLRWVWHNERVGKAPTFSVTFARSSDRW